MPRRKLKPIAIGPDGRKYVELCDRGISPLVVMIDGFTLTIERNPQGRERTLLAVDAVLDWHKRELKQPMSDKERRLQAFVQHFSRVLATKREEFAQ